LGDADHAGGQAADTGRLEEAAATDAGALECVEWFVFGSHADRPLRG
jgi:hypothetical protein